MLRWTIASILLAAAPAAATPATYDRAAGLATGETSLMRGYDGGTSAGAVSGFVGGTFNSASPLPRIQETRLASASLKTSSVPAPDKENAGKKGSLGLLGVLMGLGGAVLGGLGGLALGGPIGALLGSAAGFGIGVALSKLLS